MVKLKYGNTNTFFINGLLIDTDYAGTLHAFYRVLKEKKIKVGDIKYVLATHYHPDHMGIIGDLIEHGVKHLLIDVQKDAVHFSDHIFARERIKYLPVDERRSSVISCNSSREFLNQLGISGEIIHTPSHSPDSISLIMDNGDCFVGDLEPLEYIEGYNNNMMLEEDWERILSFDPKRIYYAHRPEEITV
jgi:glyoxylase-like metal-dependent hydrolase (beta-lactamase superfamily II)